MSDEMAAKAEEERKQVEQELTAEQKAQQERLWDLRILVDPVTWETVLVPNKNVTTQGQVTVMLELAQKQVETNNLARLLMSILARMLGERKKGLFGGK